jgi:hypothetical protein
MITPNSLIRDFRIKNLFSSSVKIAFIGFFMTIRFIDLNIAFFSQSHYTAQPLSLPVIVSAREWVGDERLDYLGWWKKAINWNYK